MDKPKEVGMLEDFLRIQNRIVKKSEEELADMLTNCFRWFLENKIKPDNTIEKMAFPKVMDLAIKAIKEEVHETLSQG